VTAWGRFDNNSRFAALPWPASEKSLKAEDIDATMVLQIGSTKVEWKNDDLAIRSVEVKLSLGSQQWSPRHVNIEYYPHFRLPFALEFRAWWDKSPNNTVQADPSGIEPPLVVQLEFSFFPNFMVADPDCANATYADGARSYDLSGWLQLTPAVQSGITSLNVCMWLLAATTCAVTLVWCALAEPHEHIRFDLTCFSATLLFAIPAMRGLLPAMPAAGTQHDLVHIHGQLWLVTISIVLQVVKMVLGMVHDEAKKMPGSNLSSWVHKVMEVTLAAAAAAWAALAGPAAAVAAAAAWAALAGLAAAAAWAALAGPAAAAAAAAAAGAPAATTAAPTAAPTGVV
jgi:hypothetical protein